MKWLNGFNSACAKDKECLNIVTYLTGIIDSSSKDFSDFMLADWHKINIQIILY